MTKNDVAPINTVNKDLALVYALQGKGPTEIGELLGCSKSYISQLHKPIIDKIKAFLAFQEDPTKLWEYREWQLLNSIDEEDIKETKVLARFTSAGICRDKVNIAQGKAPISTDQLTFNVVFNDNRSITVEQGSKDNDKNNTLVK